MTLAPVSKRFPNVPAGFDHRSAEVVYTIISKLDDDTAEMFADVLVGEIHQRAIGQHDTEIRKSLDDLLHVYGDRLRADLTRSYVAKRAGGEPVTELLDAAAMISKAAWSPDPRDLSERAKKQNRDLVTGRFVTMHHNIGYDKIDDDGRRMQPLSDREARHKGIAAPTTRDGKPVELSRDQKLAYQQAYQQVQAVLQGKQRDTTGKFLHLHYSGHPAAIHALPGRGADLPIDADKHLHSVAVSEIPAHDQLSTYDTYGAVRDAVGQNYALGADENGANPGVQRIRDLHSGLNPAPHQVTGAASMQRLGASAKFLDDSFTTSDGNSVLPRRVQAALRAGQVVGTYGPEAANVIGPTADRTAYRYRGTERAPDRSLLVAQEALRRNPGLKTSEDRREVAVHGLETDAGWRPSSVLNYFRSRLPNADLNTLQRKSGTIPPSEGVIFNRDGKIVTQAVGYGDDHYLPFNLGKLRGLRGGEYIRTRTYGGPTTEDVYTGLIGGAKAMSVVSHNGVYTVEFDQGFTGKRRYNDKAQRMIARYGYLLDAVKNGEITTGTLDTGRRAELERDAAAQYDPDSEPLEYTRELDRLTTREMRNPRLSEEQRQQAAADFLDGEALKHKTRDGHEMTREEYVNDWLDKQGRGDDEFRRDIARRSGLTTADPANFNAAAIRAMGLSDRYDQFEKRRLADYKSTLQPLKLDGPGYALALQALQEQFPYYIKSVDYHPWRDARNGRDTGYVRPKANRPAAALSGYFDSEINGQGKVHANTTRGQASQVRDYRGRSGRLADQVRDTARSTADRIVPGRDSADAREMRMQADADLVAAIGQQTAFGSSFHGAGVQGLDAADQARGSSISAMRSELATKLPAFAEIHGMTADDIRTAQSTPEGADALHRKLKDALASVKRHSIVDLDPSVVRRFEDEGRQQAPRAFDRNETGYNLRAADGEHDFGQRVYARGSGATADEIRAAYAADPRIQGVLPSMDDDPAPVQESLERRHRGGMEWRQNGRNPGLKPARYDALPHDVEGLVRAKQLRRRLAEAQEREAEADEPGIGFAGGSSQSHFDLPGGGTLHFDFGPSATSSDQTFARDNGISLS